MNTYSETRERRLYRDADRAVLGGVCAGLADYFGLNLKVTRILAFIAFLTAMPFAIIAYLAAVCLIPAASYRGRDVVIESRCCWGVGRSRRRSRRSRRMRDREHREHSNSREFAAEAPAAPVRPTIKEVRERYKTLDKRLAELEKKVTSPRFQLEQEFRKL